ncbi:hypothetical protein VP01_448g6 [Puccinia sorghi]|uniref:Retrovirus-related Pol polyprotein from transposon TNT 1-94-like beta-barrel domain-containing protein n=1 Tax=Puccinia sorghi TaxID=27349 RepID=A0A0L6UR77_9BASI|nr:hypothetical protein VP01_448g6 [Puccinia sorghi]
MANSEGGTSKSNIPKLDDTNFLHFSMQIKPHLRHKGLIKYITEVPGVLSGAAAEAVNKNHAETVDILMNYMSETAFEALYTCKNRTGATSKASEKTSEEQTDSAAALMHEFKKGKKKFRRGPYCAPGKHNSEATSHDADHCWQLHPELRPPNSFNPPTTQLVEVDEGHESEVSLILTEATSKPTVLDSGATHHLINNPDVFNPIAESNIKISTGGHSEFLNATTFGTATLINHRGKRIVLENALLVPTLNQSLISIPQLFTQELSIRNTSDKGACVLIENCFQLLGSFENNLLEIQSSHFEVIKSDFACYQSCPNTPNWHLRLDHPNRKYQSLMVPNSEIVDCDVCKS